MATNPARYLCDRLQLAGRDGNVEISLESDDLTAVSYEDDLSVALREPGYSRKGTIASETQAAAAGGVAPLRPESRRAMREGGKVVWLIAQPETILRRMSGDSTTAARRQTGGRSSPTRTSTGC